MCYIIVGEGIKNTRKSRYFGRIQTIYSFQGLILYCVVYFYRSGQDQHLIIAAGNQSSPKNMGDDKRLSPTKNHTKDEDCKEIS